ncbi:hypothetical protein GCM10010404_08730 [Nonomuraea africana]
MVAGLHRRPELLGERVDALAELDRPVDDPDVGEVGDPVRAHAGTEVLGGIGVGGGLGRRGNAGHQEGGGVERQSFSHAVHDADLHATPLPLGGLDVRVGF